MTHTLHFHDFASLSTVRGEFFSSPEFMLLDNQWSVEMYPGGDEEEMYPGGDEEGSLYLQNMSNNAIDVEYGFSVKDGGGKKIVHQSTTHHTFDPANSTGLSSWGVGVAKRSLLLSSLIDGTLIIEVRMKLTAPTYDSVSPPFFPETPSGCKMIQGLFLNGKFADIVFEVVGDDALPVTFSAHRVIVSSCSSILADLCESHGGGTIQITGVSPDVFRLLLSYIYSMKISNDDMKTHAKEIIDVADRFGFTSLKLEGEACFVEGTIITVENVMDHLLYAESKNLALLKEASVDYIVANKADAFNKLNTNDLILPGSLIKDLLVALIRNEKEDGTVGGIESELAFMRISELRKKAYKKGLDVDGSREMLIVAIEESL